MGLLLILMSDGEEVSLAVEVGLVGGRAVLPSPAEVAIRDPAQTFTRHKLGRSTVEIG